MCHVQKEWGGRALLPAEIYRQELKPFAPQRSRCWLCVGGGHPAKSVHLPGPSRVFSLQPAGGLRVGSGDHWGQPTRQRGGDRSLPGVCSSKLEGPARRPSLLDPGRPCLSAALPADVHAGLLAPWRDSRVRPTPLFLGPAKRWPDREQGPSRRGRAPGPGGARGRRGARSQALAALQLAGPLRIAGGRHTDVHHVVAGGLVVGCAVGDLLL